MTGVQSRPVGDDTAGSLLQGGGDSVARVTSPLTTAEHGKHWMKVYRTTIASSVSSVFSSFASFPLDSVKTRMQAYRYRRATDCVKHTYKSEGFKGFWRGALAPLFSITLVRTCSFSIYQMAKYKYSAAIGKATGGDEPLVTVNRPGSTPTLATIACFSAAGATAGACLAFVACPFELTKMSAQLSGLMAKSNHSSMDDPILRNNQQQKGTFKTAKYIIEQRGYAGMYSGFRFHLLRDTVGTAIYFGTYESTKQVLVKLQRSDSPTSPLSVAMAGAFCGVASWACIYPIDTAKIQYQRNLVSTPRGDGPVKVPKIEFFNPKRYSGKSMQPRTMFVRSADGQFQGLVSQWRAPP